MMETRKEEGVKKKLSGKYNCAQSVLCTYSDLVGFDEETCRNMAGSFGCGMGNTEGTCGSLVGAGMVLGMIHKDRSRAMKSMSALMERFQERNGATRCKEIKGIATKKVLRKCHLCVSDACEFLEQELEKTLCF